MRISDVTFDIETGAVLERWNVEECDSVALCRGQQTQWNKSQIDKSNAGLAAGQGYGTTAGGELGYLTPQLQGIAANPISPEERAGRLSATGGAFDSMAQKAGERVAKTRNSAGYGSILDELARGKSKAMGETEAGLDTTAFNRKMAALGGMQGLYGTNVGAQSHLLTPGSPNFQPGFWGNFLNNLLGAGGQVGAAAVGH